VGGDSTLRDVSQDRLPAELAAALGACHQSVGFNLAGPEPPQVILNVGFEVVGMPRVRERPPGARFQVVDPGKAVRLDKIEIQPEAIDDKIARPPADSLFKLGEVRI